MINIADEVNDELIIIDPYFYKKSLKNSYISLPYKNNV